MTRTALVRRFASAAAPRTVAACAALVSVSASTATASQDAGAGSPWVVVEPDRLLARGTDGRLLIEAHLAIAPGDARHRLVGAIATSADIAETDCELFTTFDGGTEWARHRLGLRSCGDPWGNILPGGTAVMTVLGTPPGAGEEEVHLLVYRSDDGGRTWPDAPISLGRNHDHQTTVFDRFRGRLYVVSAQTVRRPEPERYGTAVFVAWSVDDGRTFAESTSVFPMGTSFNTMTPAALSDGTVVVPFSDYARRAPGGEAPLDAERDWALSTADGVRFSPPYLISTECERTFPVMAAGWPGTASADRLFYACNDGTFQNIWVHRSEDRGISWSDPVALNRGSGRNPYARTPAVAAGTDGSVVVSFHDGRRQPSYRGIFRCQRLYVAASHDGGDSWSEEAAVSTEPSCPALPANGDAGMRWPQGGDYHGLAALPDGAGFALVWSDARDGAFALRTAAIRWNQ